MNRKKSTFVNLFNCIQGKKGKMAERELIKQYKVSPDTEPHGKASRKIRILALQDFYHIT